jgi:hypothetical protein
MIDFPPTSIYQYLCHIMSNDKRCRDRDFLRPYILRDVETVTLRDQEIWRMSRPRPAETE